MLNRIRRIRHLLSVVRFALVVAVSVATLEAGWPPGSRSARPSIQHWDTRTNIGPVNYSTTVVSGIVKRSYISYGYGLNTSFSGSAFQRTPYFVSGPKGIPAKLLDEKGLYEFFEEEPIGNYVIKRTRGSFVYIADGVTVTNSPVTYRHIPDEKEEWRTTLADALAGRLPVEEKDEDAEGDDKDAAEKDAKEESK